MAPEMHLGRWYKGSAIDVFEIAIVLFILYTAQPAFRKATQTDPWYKYIAANRFDLFWKAHSRHAFSAEFRHLLERMFQFQPNNRATIEEIKADAWYNMEVPTHEEIFIEFA
jgi:serine/threonine protein kinase